MSAIRFPKPHTLQLDDGQSIFHRVERLRLIKCDGGRLIFQSDVPGLQPVKTDSHGALYSRMTTAGEPRLLTLVLDFVHPAVFRVKVFEGTDEPRRNLPFLVAYPPSLGQVEVQQGEAPLHCLRYMGEKRGYQTVEQLTAYCELRSSALRIRVFLDPYRLEVSRSDGTPITGIDGPERNAFCQNDDPGLSRVRGSDQRALFTTSLDLAHDEGIYGYGERFRAFGRQRSEQNLFHCDALGTTTDRTYKNVPFFLSSKGYGLYVHTAGVMRSFIGSRTAVKHTLCVDDDVLEYYFIDGPAPADVLDRYTDLTGKAPVPPFWSFGVWMSRCTYRSEDEVMQIVDKMRSREIGLDVVNLDPGWMDADTWQCTLQFHPEHFPDPVAFLKRLREKGVRACLWQLPYIPQTSSLHAKLKEQGAFASGTPFAETVIDYSSPKAVATMCQEFLRLFRLGASVIKTDFGEEAPLDGNFHAGSGRFAHNLYPFLYNQAVYDYTKEGTGEGLVWARSAWAGSQRFPIHWGGDATSDYPNLACQVRAALNFGMSGFTFWSSDIAGITGVATPDLYVRWTQFGVFNTHMRYHSGYPVEPWNYGPEAEQIVHDWIDLRYRLLPYIYAQSERSAARGLPMMRPLVLVHPDDRNVRDMDDQFYFGDDLMIAPVLDPGLSRRVYLPQGEWYELLTGRKVSSQGQWIAWQGVLRDCPLYVRAGTVLPLGPRRCHTGEVPVGPMTLLYFPGPSGTAWFAEPDHRVIIHHESATASVRVKLSGPPAARTWRLMPVAGAAMRPCADKLGPLLPMFNDYPLPEGAFHHCVTFDLSTDEPNR